MSEIDNGIQGDSGVVLVTPSSDTAGAMLRAAREKAGLHVAALAVAIKIPVKKLEALEADELHGTHDLVFTRALASSVCRALKIDAKPILAALPQTVVRELHVDDNGINAPFSAGAASHPRSVNEFVSQPWVILVLALCAGALVMAASGWWGHKDAQSAVVSSTTVADEVVVPQAMSPVVIPAPVEAKAETAPVVVPLPQPAASAVVAEVVKSSTAPASSPQVAGLKPPVATDTKQVVSTPAPAAIGSELVMAFKAKHQAVWVEVIDAKGEARLRRNVAAGERVECGGVLPLSVVIGRADSVDVEVRGKPFNFTPFAKENVARFEVK